MIVTLDEAKQYLKIDSDITEEDTLVQLFIDTATEMVNTNVSTAFTSSNNLAKLAVFCIVADLYENRSMMADKTSEKIRQSVESILARLLYCY